MAISSLPTLFLTFLLFALTHSQSQSVTLYSTVNQGGQFVSVGANYIPTLIAYNFDNTARSTCVTGVWLFYNRENYNTGFNDGMEYVFGNNYCVNFLGLGGLVSSVRFAGSPNDYRAASITFYTGTYFQGDEEYTYSDLSSLSLGGRITSLIVTGAQNEAWTLYEGTNYSGQAACIYPPVTGTPFEPAFIYDISIISVRTIRSVRRGCFGKVANVSSIETRQGFQAMSSAVSVEPVQVEKQLQPDKLKQ